MNNPFQDLLDEGVLSTLANKVMGAAPDKPKYKVGQKVSYETSQHQPKWKDGGKGTGHITDYSNGHYMINGNPVNHHEIKKVHEDVGSYQTKKSEAEFMGTDKGPKVTPDSMASHRSKRLKQISHASDVTEASKSTHQVSFPVEHSHGVDYRHYLVHAKDNDEAKKKASKVHFKEIKDGSSTKDLDWLHKNASVKKLEEDLGLDMVHYGPGVTTQQTDPSVSPLKTKNLNGRAAGRKLMVPSSPVKTVGEEVEEPQHVKNAKRWVADLGKSIAAQQRLKDAMAARKAAAEHANESSEVREVGGRKMVSAEAAVKYARELAKKRGPNEKASMQDLVAAHKHLRGESVEVDEGLLKTIKRSTSGWGSFDNDKPKDIVSRNKAHDTKTLKLLHGTDTPQKGSPRDLQKKVIARELKKRNESTLEIQEREFKSEHAANLAIASNKKDAILQKFRIKNNKTGATVGIHSSRKEAEEALAKHPNKPNLSIN